jgi:hypothetical protein
MEDYDWGHWTPPNGVFCIPKSAFGFIYKITEKNTKKYYIGCKQLVKKIKRKPLKGKKRNRISLVESDWRDYCSSSGEISEDIKNNKDNYNFEIISFHESKSMLKYAEAEYLVKNDCLFDECCYNQMINIRINGKHFKKHE